MSATFQAAQLSQSKAVSAALVGRSSVCRFNSTFKKHQVSQLKTRKFVSGTRGRALKLHAAATALAAPPIPVLTEVGELVRIPGGKGKAVKVAAGQYLKVINTHGEQVVDFFAFSPDLKEVLSMHHTHDTIRKLIPQPGDGLYTNCRNEILTLLEDSGPGVHDTTVAACDYYLYVSQIGEEAAEQHDSCTNNLHNALGELGLKLTDEPRRYLPPAPFNLWMAVSYAEEGTQLSWDPPAEGQKPGDHVLFKANMDTIVVMSACPHDLSPINGPNGPKDVHCQILAEV